MAEKIEWHGKIPDKVKWLTFAKQSGYTYNNDYTEITAYTDDNRFPDKIRFVVDYNSSADARTCAVKFTQDGGTTITCHISQEGTTTFENFWKHAPKIKTPNKIPTDAVIAQSHNETMNPYEVAVGDYNRTRGNLLFSVGSGDENNRKNSFEVDNEKISADTAYIKSLSADTFNAKTFSATTIVNGSGADFVSYSASTTGSEQGAYPIGTLKINTEENVIYGINRDKDIENEVRNLSANTVTKEEFKHYCDSSASGLTDEFSAFTTKFDALSGKVDQEIKNVNTLVRNVSSNTLSLSETVTHYYDELTDKVSDVSKSYNELSQTLTGLTDRVGSVETKYDDVSGRIQSVSSTTDEFKVSLNGLSNKVETIKTDYNTLNGQVASNTQNIGTLRATSDTFLSKLDSISVGGVNLLYDTNFDTFNKSDSKWSTWGSPSTLTMTKESDGWNWISIKSTDKFQGINQNQNSRRGAGYKEFKPNTYYTFSVYAYGNSTHMDLGIHFVNETGTDNVGQVWCSNDNNYSKSWGKGVIPLASTKTRYWFTFKTPDDSTINYFNAMIGFGSLSTNPSSDEVINIAKPQLEEGTIPTDWKENGDYYDKRMSSKIEQTASSITLSVQKNVENKLSETGIDIKNNIINLKADTTSFLGSDGKQYIKVEKDDKGMPHLIFYGTDGKTPLYDLGYTGLRTLVTNSTDGKFSSKICLVDIGNYKNTVSYANKFMKMTEESSDIIPAYIYFASYYYSNGTIVYGEDEKYGGNYYNTGATRGSHAEDIDWLKNSDNLIPDGYYAEWEKVYMQEIGSMGIDDLAINNINCIHISNGRVVGYGDMYTRGSKVSTFYYFTDEQGNELNFLDYNYIKDYIFKNQN